jgi:hypothetical protein
MTRELLVSLSPEAVIDSAKAYFTDARSGYSGTLVEDGDGFARFQTFRGQLAVAAMPEGEQTLVRCSTLRYHPSIGKFLLSLESEPSLSGT